MTPLPAIEPSVDVDLIYPANAAYMARSDLHQTRMLGFQPLNIDAVTTLLIGILGGRSTVRHRSCATDEILEFLTDSGLQIDEDMHLFETGDEAEAISDRLIDDDAKLFWPYPLRDERFADTAHVVPPALWAQLNSKERLGDLVPANALPDRRIVPLAQLTAELPKGPSYLKAAGDAATGWGFAVRYVATQDDIQKAQSDFKEQGVDSILVEEAIDVVTCWCANLGVVDGGVTYLGAAEQVFSAPAQQSGSIIDPDNALPPDGIALAIEVAEAAHRKGFRGICGLDIGLSSDGRLFVFDPNFRFNSSTSQVLLHQAACERSGLSLSSSFGGLSTRKMSDILATVRGPVEQGWFVPTRMLDATLLSAAGGVSLCSGFVLGQSRSDADANAQKLSDMIA